MNTCKKKHVISIDFHFTQNAFCAGRLWSQRQLTARREGLPCFFFFFQANRQFSLFSLPCSVWFVHIIYVPCFSTCQVASQPDLTQDLARPDRSLCWGTLMRSILNALSGQKTCQLLRDQAHHMWPAKNIQEFTWNIFGICCRLISLGSLWSQAVLLDVDQSDDSSDDMPEALSLKLP